MKNESDLPSILQRGKELAAEATARPWHYDGKHYIWEKSEDSAHFNAMIAEMRGAGTGEPIDTNAAYIVHACNTWPLLAAEVERLRAQINEPLTADFIEAVRIEAAHQRERWGNEHDAGKTDADWFWLIGYLAGKALHNPGDDREKQLHRIITIGAAAANWHLAKQGATNMRPGIAEPQA